MWALSGYIEPTKLSSGVEYSALKESQDRIQEIHPYTLLREETLSKRRRALDIIVIVTLGIIFSAVIILGYLAGTMASSDKSEITVSELSAGNIALSKKLYGALSANPGNIFFSPASLDFALALLYAGTDGETAKQIRTALMLPDPKEKTYAAVANSLNSLTSAKNVTLSIADALFVQENFKVKQTYVDIAKKYFMSQVANVNFTSDSAVDTINNFVAKETRDKIKELFQKGTFDEMTRLVIVNAIYFKGNWKSKFDPKATYKGDFHLNQKEKITVDFMSQKKRFKVGYKDGLNATIVVLPYEDEKLNMVLLVPNEIDGLKEVEKQLPNLDLISIVQEAQSEEIVLSMPKFKLTETMKLKSILSNLGLNHMFSKEANLSGISDEALFVSDVVQKTYIEVNEEGSEAAAATGK